ncbi:hypothetical protein GIB67_010161 [Kingdonia uniflora]|uniref:Exostosin GT47 domain-containing protein n=1 Tax=Kingdonia uniflora TaxID=39325 RepID=A0A7J7NAD7_9MAGN|nr:hypothetical protein GIB67_010161 [Kingdonia uniflora]
MECALQLPKLCRIETRRVIFFTGIIAICILVIQTLTLPYGNRFSSSFPDGKVRLHETTNIQNDESSHRSATVGNFLLSNDSSLVDSSLIPEVKYPEASYTERETKYESEIKESESDAKNIFALEKDSDPDSVQELDHNRNSDGESSSKIANGLDKKSLKTDTEVHYYNSTAGKFKESKHGFSLFNKKERGTLSSNENFQLQTASVNTTILHNPIKKEFRCNIPPKSTMSMIEMVRLLIRRHSSYRARRPQLSSIRDQELFSAKLLIENAPITSNDRKLHDPLFRNASMFSRSYELMERTLKVYMYKEGEKPIFHQPILKGIYASEGWFMKLMQENKKFLVKDPKKAHIFYMPFSTRMLEFSLYVRNSHNRTNLAEYLKNYTNMIAAKYSFWNRTGGADHFFVACHDWAPYETRHHMERCIKAMCNSDVTGGYKIGKDVSLPETYVRSARNPQRDIGGKPPSKRPILAFFAGSVHGYLRRILLSYWENKDPDMKIFGPMPPGVASKMNYIQHMQSSKYCVCAKGYNVNSPRVVEAIFYECVPVIISDNFVPPFFEVLDWASFSVFVPEKDIPKLKEILLSISDEKYHIMQMNVRKAQQHFVWHSKPVKYDLFYMTLHSIWYNRLFQIRPK